jgi:hypothetical protein
MDKNAGYRFRHRPLTFDNGLYIHNHKGMRRVLCIGVIMFGMLAAGAQEGKNTVLMPGLRAHYGFIVPHSSTIKNISWSKPWGIEADYTWLLMGENNWKYCFCYPRAGVSLFFVDFANPEVLGHSLSLYLFIEPLIGAAGHVYGTVRFGIGPAYMDNVYDSVDNPLNKFFSSPISFITLLSAGINYRFGEKFNIRLSGSFNHISNGGVRYPNLGINFPTLGLGMDYRINPLPFKYRMKDKSLQLVPYKGRFDVIFFATEKADIRGNKRYPVIGLVTSYTRVIGRISGLMMGMEFVADYADKQTIERMAMTRNSEKTDYKYIAPVVGHDLLLGRFTFQIQLGAYLYSPYKRRDPVFQHYVLSYYIYKSTFISVDLKAHSYTADFLTLRAGISF